MKEAFGRIQRYEEHEEEEEKKQHEEEEKRGRGVRRGRYAA